MVKVVAGVSKASPCGSASFCERRHELAGT